MIYSPHNNSNSPIVGIPCTDSCITNISLYFDEQSPRTKNIAVRNLFILSFFFSHNEIEEYIDFRQKHFGETISFWSTGHICGRNSFGKY
jgi:hypothetical protein